VLKIPFPFLLLHTSVLIEVDHTGRTLALRRGHHLLHDFLDRIRLALHGAGQRPAAQRTETDHTHTDLVPVLLRQAVVVRHDQITVDLHARTLLGEIQGNDRDILQTDILPDIQLRPVR